MKKNLIILCLCMSTLLFCSCGEYFPWTRHFELIGEWESVDPLIEKSRLTFYKDGTCLVENVPVRQTEGERDFYTLYWMSGNKETKEKVKSMDKWNFRGYWRVEELSDDISWGPNYYSYRIVMSPHLEMLRTIQERDSFINCTNADDVYTVSLDAYTATIFPPARLEYLSFYTCDPDEIYTFDKSTARIRNIFRRLKNKKYGDE